MTESIRTGQYETQLHAVKTIEATFPSFVYLPKDYDGKTPCPLMLFLHGAGERGTDLSKVKVHGPPRLIAEGKDFPFIVVSPQCPEGQWWDVYALAGLLDRIEEDYVVDPDRIYVTGLSMGGFATWKLAALQPNRFAAIAPVCGGGEPFHAKLFAHVPVWAFHGDRDSVVPLERSKEMIDALRKAGANPKFTVYPGVGHDSWKQAYNNPELYDWLSSHTGPQLEGQ